MLRIGAYINVFLEEKSNIRWESRLSIYDTIYSKNKHRNIPLNAYIGLSFLCILLSVLHTNYINFSNYCKICLVTQICLTIISIILFIVKSPNYIDIKKDYLAQWKKIKEIELAESYLKMQ